MDQNFKIASEEALNLLNQGQQEFIGLFTHGSLSVEIYKLDKTDKQKPHDRDEIYVIIGGSSRFYKQGETVNCKAGDFLFVPAGHEHYFFDFSPDFSTWVFFYGPVGGEVGNNKSGNSI